MIYILPFLTILAHLAPELLVNDTKKSYVDEGYKWINVLLFSTLGAIATALFTLIIKPPLDIIDSIQISFLSALVYLFIQGLFTDLRVLKFNRKVLRVSMLLALSAVVYIVKQLPGFEIEILLEISPFIIISLIVLVFAPLFKVGPSDGRAMMATLPLLAVFDPNIAYYAIFGGLALTIITRLIIAEPKKRKLVKELRAGEGSELSYFTLRRIAGIEADHFMLGMTPFLICTPIIAMVYLIFL